MTKNKNKNPENGVLTSSVNAQNKEFKELQLFLLNKSNSLSEKEKLKKTRANRVGDVSFWASRGSTSYTILNVGRKQKRKK